MRYTVLPPKQTTWNYLFCSLKKRPNIPAMRQATIPPETNSKNKKGSGHFFLQHVPRTSRRRSRGRRRIIRLQSHNRGLQTAATFSTYSQTGEFRRVERQLAVLLCFAALSQFPRKSLLYVVGSLPRQQPPTRLYLIGGKKKIPLIGSKDTFYCGLVPQTFRCI